MVEGKRPKPTWKSWIPVALVYGNLAVSIVCVVWKGGEFPSLKLWLVASVLISVSINVFAMISAGGVLIGNNSHPIKMWAMTYFRGLRRSTSIVVIVDGRGTIRGLSPTACVESLSTPHVLRQFR